MLGGVEVAIGEPVLVEQGFDFGRNGFPRWCGGNLFHSRITQYLA